MNLRDIEQNLCSLTTMKITVAGTTSFFPQGVEEARDNSGMGFRKRKEKEGDDSRSTKRQESSLFYTDGHKSHLKDAEFEHQLQKYKGRVVLR